MAKEVKCEKCGKEGVCVDDRLGKLKKGGTYMCVGCLREQMDALQEALGTADVSSGGKNVIVHVRDTRC